MKIEWFFIWTNLNPLHPRMLCAKFCWNWHSRSVEEDFFFNFRQCIFAISWLSPGGKGRGPSFGQTWIIFTQGCFVPSLVENGRVVLEKKVKMWKVYDNNNNNTGDNNNDDNDGQILMRKVHLSLRLPFLVSTWATFVSCTVTQWQDLRLHWYFSSDV